MELLMLMPTDIRLYQHWSIFNPILGFITVLYLFCLKNKQLFKPHKFSLFLAIGLAIFICLWIGARFKYHYGDSSLYCHQFESAQAGMDHYNKSGEVLWREFAFLFINNNLTVNDWYLGIAAFYIGGMVIASVLLTPKHVFISFVFCITAFSFFAYGTNGLRNGMATSIAWIGLSLIATQFFKSKTISYAVGLIIIFIAYNVHSSLMLIMGATIISIFYRDTKTLIIIWGICILISLVAAGSMVNLFSHFIDDDRMQHYGTAEVSTSTFARSGFRWDFILYSAIPIVLGYYILYKRKLSNSVYTFLLNVYIIANAFWCTINSVSYSNRFAYLSWFMLPILVSYPLVTFKLFKRQSLVLGSFLLFFIIFNMIFDK